MPVGRILSLCLIAITSSAEPDERYLEILTVDRIDTPMMRLALHHDALAELSRKLHSLERNINAIDQSIDETLDKLQSLPRGQEHRRRNELSHNLRTLRNERREVERDLDEVHSRREQMNRVGPDGIQRTMHRVVCWDGFGKELQRMYVADTDDRLCELAAEEIIRATTTPMTLRIPRVFDSARSGGAWSFETIESMEVLDTVPVGFLIAGDANVKTWRALDPEETERINGRVIESPSPHETKILVRFSTGPAFRRRLDLDHVAWIKFRVFALDPNGDRADELNGGVAVVEYIDFSASGGPLPAVSYVDPGRRYAHGFEVEIVGGKIRDTGRVEQDRGSDRPRRGR